MSISVVKTAATETVKAERPDARADARTPTINGEVLRGVRVALEARLGNAPMTVEEMMGLKQGSVITLESALGDYVELFLNGTLVARGEIVAVGDKFGVRIAEIAPNTP